MPVLDVSTFLLSGHVYSLTFSLYSATVVSAETFDADLAGIPDISNASASKPLFGDLIVTFTFVGDNSTVVANVAQEIIDAIKGNHYFTTLSFIAATGDAAGVNTSPFHGLGDIANSINPSSLWAIAAIGILILFVYVGGATATRRHLA